ncbi:MAG: NAD(P)-dependent oxidoreductase, partial [Patescibacteria group bacterium]|nr:NAD(P)-dependent oxidoreductase [Patescibacteria group bacterium]
MDKILVTGYSGFIGQNLIWRLAKKYEVVGVSNVKNSMINVAKIKKDIR